ncbi:MAG: coproporphyrinogen-III oxidase family protein [Victivallaceae bacterium]|nr:coproporphyrinogen-III oxidase family protein [Victivallaceae bacterium]
MNLYVHIPFCWSKCGYCAFYSLPSPSDELIKRYMAKLLDELKAYEPPEAISTVYVGGGTPTLLTPDWLERLLAGLKRFEPVEFSVEANPETLDADKVAVLRHYITRISVGVQSFDPSRRELLGRTCTQTALERAMDLVAGAGFWHWNCDLIYAVPGQSRADWRTDLERAVATGCDHVSCYNLTAEEGARLAGSLAPCDDEADLMWRDAAECLAAGGMRRYEISNYARPGGECRHNLDVWRGGRLAGFGVAAAGFDGVRRQIEPASVEAWLADAYPELDELPWERRLDEIFAVNLRTADGWSQDLWERLPAHDPWEERMRRARAADHNTRSDFWDFSGGGIRLTEKGLLFWNDIAEEFVI